MSIGLSHALKHPPPPIIPAPLPARAVTAATPPQDNVVYNMSRFVAIQEDFDEDTGMRIARHPGGQDIPMQFAGKDATQYWNDIHGRASPRSDNAQPRPPSRPSLYSRELP